MAYSSNTATKAVSPYARPVNGKCFKCGIHGHRSSDSRVATGKVGLTTREDEEEEVDGNDDYPYEDEQDAELCFPAEEPTYEESSAKTCVMRRIMLSSKLPENTSQ